MNIDNKKYYAKLLLIGEYTVMLGGEGLSVPYLELFGQWNHDPQNEIGLVGLNKLLFHIKKSKELTEAIDSQNFEESIKQGLRFTSNIPLGYGLGSSGALVAGVYDRFKRNQDAGENVITLKNTLSLMECAFHATSSGIDPLTSYLGKAIHMAESGIIQIIEKEIDTSQFFLIDTGIQRKTSLLVDMFGNKLNTDSNFKLTMNTLAEINKSAIDSILHYNDSELQNKLVQISNIQWASMQEMIPFEIHHLWSDPNFITKLCGAGGGGMMLGYRKSQS